MKKFQVIDYFDVWGNVEEGYEINDQIIVGVIEVPNDYGLSSILEAMREKEYLDSIATIDTVELDEYDFECYDLRDKSSGKPLYGLVLYVD